MWMLLDIGWYVLFSIFVFFFLVGFIQVKYITKSQYEEKVQNNPFNIYQIHKFI